MNNNLVTIKVGSGATKVTIIPIEAHYSNRVTSNGFCRSTWFKLLKRLKSDPHAYVVFVGDILDCDRPSMREMKSKIYADPSRIPALEEDDLDHQRGLREGIIKDLKPIKHKILGMVDGDHFKLYANKTTSTWYICNQLGIAKTYLGERMGWVRVLFQDKGDRTLKFDILVRHGKSSTSSIGADINKLITQNIGFCAELYLGGHTHKKFFYSDTWLYLNKSMEIKNKLIGYARAGSMLRGFIAGHTTYPELAEYRPLSIGWPEVYIYLSRLRANQKMLKVVDLKGLS